MGRTVRFALAMVFSLAGVGAFVAGQARFDLLDPGYARPLGIGLLLVAGMFWALYGQRN